MSSDRSRVGPPSPLATDHRRKGRARAAEVGWHLETDWPEEVPVTRAEVEIVERFLADLLDELLGGGRAPAMKPHGRADRLSNESQSFRQPHPEGQI